ncbi:putative RNA-directed DNA polymerase, eukaryota, reverse transcriptase zinc-binding domain protein, partial [Tanacetum coccineum]
MANIKKHKLLLFKVDFEKAFDIVYWNFLQDVMRQMGFRDRWRKWIGACLSLASILVLVNWFPSSEFKMKRGLRQGDPLSPLLFLLVAETLQISILEACNKCFFKGISLANGGVNLSLLQYAKNLILILKYFEEALGLKVNLSKSRLFGLGTSNSEVESVASMLACASDLLPFMYLGLSVGKNMRYFDGWNEVVNRLRAMLTVWKAKTLSIGGRLTLIKYILGGLHVYYLSLFKAPQKVLKLLESIRCHFFWGSNESQKGICCVKWNTILLELNLGGLGIGSIHAKNLDLIGKWKWRFLTEKDALWRRVIKYFYRDDGGFGSPLGSHGMKGVWCDILKAISDIEDCIPSFKIYLVLNVANGLFALECNKDYYVSDRWNLGNEVGGNWDWWLPLRGRAKSDLINLLSMIDKLILNPDLDYKWKWLATRDDLAARGMVLPSISCPFCSIDVEILENYLITCPKMLPIWRNIWSWWSLDPPVSFSSFSSSDIVV